MAFIEPPIFRYYYPVADKNGNAVRRYRMVNRPEFKRLTGIDPIDNDLVGSDRYKAAQPDVYRVLGIA